MHSRIVCGSRPGAVSVRPEAVAVVAGQRAALGLEHVDRHRPPARRRRAGSRRPVAHERADPGDAGLEQRPYAVHPVGRQLLDLQFPEGDIRTMISRNAAGLLNLPVPAAEKKVA